MVNDDLRVVLGRMVKQYGFKAVSRVLHEMKAEYDGGSSKPEGGRRSRPRAGRRPKQRLSAVDYVQAMAVPADQAAIVRRAAEEFEQKAFLPTLGDMQSFCDVFGIEEPRSKSRASGIPRIFRFLVTMDVAEVERILDEQVFSGPVTLGPIADAIRDKAKEHREAGTEHA